MITLVIEVPGERAPVRIEVQETDVIGTCVVSLVKNFGFPTQDIAGIPVAYQLRPITSLRPLPNTTRFRDAHVHHEARLTLEAQEANYATIPLEEHPSVAPPYNVRHGVPHRITRRYFSFWMGASLAVIGTGLGMTAAFGQHYLAAHSRRIVSNTGPQSLPSFLPRGAIMQFAFSTHSQTVRAVEWSRDGTLIGSGGDDAQLLLWNPTTGSVHQRILHPAPVQAVAWSPQGERIVSAAGTQVAFYDTDTGALLARSTHQHTANISSVAWTPHNQMQVVTGGLDKRAIVWETIAYHAQKIFTGHDTSIEAVSWAANGQLVASASQGGVVRVWDAATVQEVHGFFQDAQVSMRTCSFAPTGASLAVGGNDGILRVWNEASSCRNQHTENGGRMCMDTPQRLRTSNHPIRALAWSPNGRYLASGSDDGSLSVWSPQHLSTPLFTLRISTTQAIHSVAWSSSNDRFATASGNVVQLWKLHS